MKLKVWGNWLKRLGYHRLPSTYQSPTPPRPVEKANWQVCLNCSRLIPARRDRVPRSENGWEETDTWTYVCPYCDHCQVGTPQDWNEDIRQQTHCHECGAELGAAYQCPECNFPRSWKRVNRPHCGQRQPVAMPHLVVRCDVFHLECVHCESVFDSLCIC